MLMNIHTHRKDRKDLNVKERWVRFLTIWGDLNLLVTLRNTWTFNNSINYVNGWGWGKENKSNIFVTDESEFSLCMTPYTTSLSKAQNGGNTRIWLGMRSHFGVECWCVLGCGRSLGGSLKRVRAWVVHLLWDPSYACNRVGPELNFNNFPVIYCLVPKLTHQVALGSRNHVLWSLEITNPKLSHFG